MRSATLSRAKFRTRRASDSPAARAVARAGLTARGVIYILLGWVAFLVAIGNSSHQANQAGALQMLAGKPYGLASLWLLGLGFAAYALWRLSEAVTGMTDEGTGAGARLKSLARAVPYALFCALTFEIISGHQRNQTRQQQDFTAKVMQHPEGRWLVGLVGLIVVIVGVVLAAQGFRRTFLKHLATSRMSPGTRRVVEKLGMIGSIARGAIIALAGVLVIDAAVTHKAAESGGIDKALLTLRGAPFGEFLVILAALGLVIFGIYGLCEARWRKV